MTRHKSLRPTLAAVAGLAALAACSPKGGTQGASAGASSVIAPDTAPATAAPATVTPAATTPAIPGAASPLADTSTRNGRGASEGPTPPGSGRGPVIGAPVSKQPAKVPAAQAAPSSDAATAAADTARGTIAVVGSTPFTRVVIRGPGGARATTLTGDLTAQLRRLSGADVWVSGDRQGDGSIRVAHFTVRTVDGNPALDGTLRESGGKLLLQTADGQSHLIANPPTGLRDLVGARVWITGNPAASIAAYGVIQPKQ